MGLIRADWAVGSEVERRVPEKQLAIVELGRILCYHVHGLRLREVIDVSISP